ncbi:hypothetical protein HPP92_013060 [Vanilla planifolia]|uniref:Apyrase n=1 Tax=Vanilla planifolia TaxID=51239 RepID=A0A835QU80_VANPL|nr:hypothetical protein HPP92_013060 [Vanilla planifolia]
MPLWWMGLPPLVTPEYFLQPVYRDPCTPKGYGYGVEQRKLSSAAFSSKIEFNGTPNAFGNFSECRSAALMILQKEKDDPPDKLCYFGSSYIPKLPGRVIATENFFHTSKFFGLGPSSLLSDLALAGERFCEEDWLNLKDNYRTLEEEALLRYCFSSAYIVALLHDCLGIAMNDSRIMFSNQVGEVPLDWALGAFIMQKTSDGAAASRRLFVVVGALPLPMLYGFLVISILAFPVFSLLKRWKPQFRLKTIHDMENGRVFLKSP